MTMKGIILLCVTLFCVAGNGMDIGDRLARTFLLYHALPVTAASATSSGWVSMGPTCDPLLGYAFASDGAPSLGNPIIMYYTAAGQVAGVGIVHYGEAPLASQKDFWRPMNSSAKNFIMNIHFRAPSVLCSSTPQRELIGNQVVINQDSINFNVPLTDVEAVNAKWAQGNCISGMGTHWAYDWISAPTLSYRAEQTVPLMPMYYNGTITAFLVDTASFQDVEPVSIWEGPFISSLFCKNLCKGCSWDSTLTSTLHFLFHDHSTVHCPTQCNPF